MESTGGGKIPRAAELSLALNRPARWIPQLALASLVAFPGVSPLTFGPSGSALQWLITAACACVLWWRWAGTLPASLGLVCIGVVAGALFLHLPPRPESVMLAAGLALIWLSAGVSANLSRAKALQAGLLGAAGVNAVIALLQYFGAAPALAPLLSHAEAGTAYGNLRQPNQLATLCWIGAAVLVFGTLQIRRPAACALMVLLAMGSAASVSRTGVVQGIALFALAGWWRSDRRTRLGLCLLGATAYLGASWALPVVLEATTGVMPSRTILGRFGADYGCSSRAVLWSNVLHLISLRPLAGWGWGELDYAHFTTLYPGPRFCFILDNAHNLPLQLAVELGIPVALLVCCGFVAWACAKRPWREAVPLRQLGWGVLVVLLLHSMLEYPLWYGPFQMALGVAMGWLCGSKKTGMSSAWAFPRAVSAALMLSAVAYAAWDYVRVSQVYLAPEQRLARWRDGPLDHAQRSWLFASHARFADLTLAAPSRANAERVHTLALDVLHYSPEPPVIERLIESAVLLGRDQEALLQLARFRAAFPAEYEAWWRANRPAPNVRQQP